MTFPVQSFKQLSAPELITDERLPDERLKRNRTIGHRDPYWMIAMTTNRLKYDIGMALNAYLNSLFGAYTIFDLPNPYPQPHPHGILLVRQAAAKGRKDFEVLGLSLNQANAVKAGYFIRFGQHDAIYQVTENADSDAFGYANVKITPALQENIGANEDCDLGNDVTLPVCLNDRSSANISADNGKFITTSVELITQI